MKSTAILAGTIAAVLLPLGAVAQTILEQSGEHRYQLDFHVNDAALAKLLPSGWEPAIATEGPAKDCNLRLIFIDRLTIFGPDGKAAARHSSRSAILAIPVKQAATGSTGQMIIDGITDDSSDASVWFGVPKPAKEAKAVRSLSSLNGVVTGQEDWVFSTATGEHLSLHVEYEHGTPTQRTVETKFFNPADPSRYLTSRTEQSLDIQRNATTHPTDHVRKFTYKAGGGHLAALFDGHEKVLSWDLQPGYLATVSAP